MRDETTAGVPKWSTSASARDRNVAQRAATDLLDILAPEAAVRRAERPRLRVERHRTPRGCVLQAANAALSVSWFPDGSPDAPLGELHVVVWRGTVARRGSPQGRDRAQVAGELVTRPVEQATDDYVWRAADGTLYTTESLASRCLALLEDQIEEA